MANSKAWFVTGCATVSCLSVCAAAGCAEAGVTEIHATASAPDGGSTHDARVAVPANFDAGSSSSGAAHGRDASVATDNSEPSNREPDSNGASTGETTVVDAATVSHEGAACPSGWTCADPAKPLADMGIPGGKVTDADGNAVSAACGNGQQVTCDPNNPKKSCPELADPFCAHVSIALLGVDIYSCAQKCTP